MTINPVELIRKKRDGGVLSREEIDAFFCAYLKGKLPDYQVAAMLMAIYFRGLTEPEMYALCDTMIQSGTVADLSMIEAPKIDKHSTGGVGDKTSLMLAPIVASLGVAVPMISGRGLGHTGGTLDKLEAIPNFEVNLSMAKFRAMLRRHHCALIGQTKSLAPLDKLLYALRDVTATVESIPLIATSIMSKKIASGLDGLVLDVKTGIGAFMSDYEQSRKLAQTLIAIGHHYGKRVSAFITFFSGATGCEEIVIACSNRTLTGTIADFLSVKNSATTSPRCTASPTFFLKTIPAFGSMLSSFFKRLAPKCVADNPTSNALIALIQPVALA